jgi:hypothetical protein
VLEMAADLEYEEKLRATIETLDIAQAMREIGNTRASVTADSYFIFSPDLCPISRQNLIHLCDLASGCGPVIVACRKRIPGVGDAKDSIFPLDCSTRENAALRGSIFESMVHRMASTIGCKGRIRCLERSLKWKRGPSQSELLESDFQLGPIEQQVFEKLDNIGLDTYNVPLARNFAAVDAIIPCKGLLLQMTVSSKHATKLFMLENLKSHGSSTHISRKTGQQK